MSNRHLGEELPQSSERITVNTQYGPVRGGRAGNGAIAFLEIPYALPPERFQDAKPLPPNHRYEDKDYVYEKSFCAQPDIDVMPKDVLGLGEPTENPLFVNIVCPPSFSSNSKLPVKVFIHGGFLQSGSPHILNAQAQYVSAERSEVWVNIGYRVSAFGFLASKEPKLDGNFGFKDQWLALLWIRDNIGTFGGDPDNIQITGFSAGAHSVHQILHYASRLPQGEQAPFRSAILHSNAIVASPRTLGEARTQFRALCRSLNIDPDGEDVLSTLRNRSKLQWRAVTDAIESGDLGIENSTFRGSLDNSWAATLPDPMTWQHTGELARALSEKGVRSIVLGEVVDEWFIYSTVHQVFDADDIEHNLRRYYPADVVQNLMTLYPPLPDDAPRVDVQRLFGKILSDGQVHLPVRLLARDLIAADFPVVRYEIRWAPQQERPLGFVSHGADRSIWSLRLPTMRPEEADVARTWLDKIDAETKSVEANGNTRELTEVLTLKKDMNIVWRQDDIWEEKLRLQHAFPGEHKENI